MAKETPATGYAALILFVIIFIIMFYMSDVEIETEDDDDDNYSSYEGESKTLRQLNAGLPSCSECVRRCEWTLVDEDCEDSCIDGVNCGEEDLG